MKENKNTDRLFFVVLAVFVAMVVFGGSLLFIAVRREPYFSSPVTERSPMKDGWGNVYGDENTSPAGPVPAPPPGVPFNPVKTRKIGNVIHLTFDKRRFIQKEDRRLSYRSIVADSGSDIVRLPQGGQIQLTAIAHVFDAGKGIPTKRIRDGRSGIIAEFVRPKDLKLLTAEEMVAAGISNDDLIFPDYRQWKEKSLFRAVLTPQGAPEIKYKHASVFDARTRWRVNSGGLVGRPVSSTALNFWHDGPVLFTYDVIVGPAVEVEVPLDKPGWQMVVNGEFRIQFLAHVQSWASNRSWDTKGMAEITIKKSKHLSTAVFLIDDPKFSESCLVQTVLRDGQIEGNQTFTASSSQIYLAHLRHSKGEIAKLRLRYFPNRYKLVYPIKRLPYFKENNRDVSNLFQVRIPHVTVKSLHDFSQFIGAATHRKFNDLHYENENDRFPSNYFPHEFTDVTPMELLIEYDKHTVGNRLVVPEDEFVIKRVKPRSLMEVLNDLWQNVRMRISP